MMLLLWCCVCVVVDIGGVIGVVVICVGADGVRVVDYGIVMDVAIVRFGVVIGCAVVHDVTVDICRGCRRSLCA